MAGPDRGAVSAVLLAAGSSRRMGRNKLLLEVAGETVVRRAARAALESGVDEVLVVLGHEAEAVAAELGSLACVPVVNPDHLRGQGTSLRFGLGRIREDAAAVIVLLADMPFVTAEMIGAVLARYRETGAPLVVSRYGDVQAPPTLYDRRLFAELAGIPDEHCGRRVVRRHESEAARLDWPEAALRDLDVVEDYEEARAELRS